MVELNLKQYQNIYDLLNSIIRHIPRWKISCHIQASCPSSVHCWQNRFNIHLLQSKMLFYQYKTCYDSEGFCEAHLTHSFHSGELFWGRSVDWSLILTPLSLDCPACSSSPRFPIWTESRHSPGTVYVLINNLSPLSKYVFKQLVKYALCVNTITDVIWSESMTQSHNDTDVDVICF